MITESYTSIESPSTQRVASHIVAFLVPILIYSFGMVDLAGATSLTAAAFLFISLLVFVAVVANYDRMLLATLLVGLTLWQNFALGLWSQVSNVEVGSVHVATLTVTLFCAGGVLAVSQLGHKRLSIFGVPCILMLIGFALAGLSAEVSSVLGYARNFVAAGLLIYIGIMCGRDSSHEVSSWIRLITKLVVGVLAVGSALEAVLGTFRWRSIVGVGNLSHLGGTSHMTTVLGFEVPRLGSVLIEPINTAFVAAGAIVILFAVDRRVSLTLFLAVGVLLGTSGKGAMLFVAFAAMLILAPTLSARISRRPYLLVCGSLAAIFVVGLFYLFVVLGAGKVLQLLVEPEDVLGHGQSTTYHISAFVASFSQLLEYPFGHAPGEGGNLNPKYSSQPAKLAASGGESGLGVLVYQLGILGLASFVICASRLIRAAGSDTSSLPAVGLIAAWVGSVVYQEQPLGPVSCGLIMLSAGLFVGLGFRRDNLHADVAIQ